MGAGGGPEDIVTLMEGESLLNDATAISLFQVFFTMVKNLHPSANLGIEEPGGILKELASVAGQILWLAVGELQAQTSCLLASEN